MYLLPKLIAAKARLVLVVGTPIVYSDIPQTKNIPSWLQRLNPQLVQLHGEISILLHFLSCTWGSTFILAPALHVGHPQPSVPHRGERGQKQHQLIGISYAGQWRMWWAIDGVFTKCLWWQCDLQRLQQTGTSLWWESFPVSAEAGAGMWRQWWPCPLWTTQQWHLVF